MISFPTNKNHNGQGIARRQAAKQARGASRKKNISSILLKPCLLSGLFLILKIRRKNLLYCINFVPHRDMISWSSWNFFAGHTCIYMASRVMSLSSPGSVLACGEYSSRSEFWKIRKRFFLVLRRIVRGFATWTRMLRSSFAHSPIAGYRCQEPCNIICGVRPEFPIYDRALTTAHRPFSFVRYCCQTRLLTKFAKDAGY